MACSPTAPTVGMHCNYSPGGGKQFDLTVTAVSGTNVSGTYQDAGTPHTVTNVPHSNCCDPNTWGCPNESGGNCVDAWRVLSDRRSKVPA